MQHPPVTLFAKCIILLAACPSRRVCALGYTHVTDRSELNDARTLSSRVADNGPFFVDDSFSG